MKSRKAMAFMFCGILAISIFSGCSRSKASSKEGVLVKDGNELNVFNWSEYLPDKVWKDFGKKYGIKVKYTTYSSNEEMLAKIMAGGGQFDVSVASDYMVDAMKKQNLVEPIDYKNIPNYKNIGKQFKGLSFDKENKYTVPYMWGAAVVAVNSKKINKQVTTYADLWDSAFKNSMVVLDDERALIGICLKKLGYSFNETDPAKLKQAKEEFLKLKPNIKMYDSDSPKTALVNGEAAAGYVWSAEAVLAQKENPDLKIYFPEEGLYLWQDNFIIPKDAKNKKNAELFMNYILDPKVSASISKEFPYANPNEAAHKYIDKDTINNKSLYLDQSIIDKGEHLKDLGDAIKSYDDIWTEVKSE
ncbi:polyamine ABC transporter substrate-binding protein [Clostridium oryzae]|uniref:Spermidine/putrescine-binding periplasmic protein n=1 Tax=Clostridium oryzae TaxID=1450648 RepID=A0A1V4IQJ6_9CLOT|nr:spermidine/putrescine ABC transporter substrate-binding protein [Clostridium oryzae]OPJ62282.1 spermidine/putrescine-binding periplasmic protein precursor [Clostridium oryzae]